MRWTSCPYHRPRSFITFIMNCAMYYNRCRKTMKNNNQLTKGKIRVAEMKTRNKFIHTHTHTHTHTHKHTYIQHSWHIVSPRYLQIKYLLSHLLKFICNPKSIFTALSQSFTDTCIAVKILSHLTRYQLRLNKVMLCLLVSALTVSKCPFCHLINAFCVFCWWFHCL